MDKLPERPARVKPGLQELVSRHHVAQIERFRELVNPYDLLVAIEHHQRDSSDTRSGARRFGMAHYPRFIAMIATWPSSDQDALLHAARRIFRVNIPTMRADLKAARMGVALDGGAA